MTKKEGIFVKYLDEGKVVIGLVVDDDEDQSFITVKRMPLKVVIRELLPTEDARELHHRGLQSLIYDPNRISETVDRDNIIEHVCVFHSSLFEPLKSPYVLYSCNMERIYSCSSIIVDGIAKEFRAVDEDAAVFVQIVNMLKEGAEVSTAVEWYLEKTELYRLIKVIHNPNFVRLFVLYFCRPLTLF